jgi:hypothetical protein
VIAFVITARRLESSGRGQEVGALTLLYCANTFGIFVPGQPRRFGVLDGCRSA